MPGADLFDRGPAFYFSQYSDYLLFAESASFHLVLLLYAVFPVLACPHFGGQVNSLTAKLADTLKQVALIAAQV